MRNNGFIGLMQVIHASAREGFGSRRAAQVMLVIGLILTTPILLIALLIWLLV